METLRAEEVTKHQGLRLTIDPALTWPEEMRAV
jgi:hypothetical protein